MDVRLLEARDSRAWDAFVEQHPQSTFCHKWAYRQVVTRTFGHQPHYLTALHNGQISGILPLFAIRSRLFGRMLVSLPFVDYGGICADGEPAEHELWDHAVGLARREGLDSIELRHSYSGGPGLSVGTHKVSLVLPLPVRADSVWTGLKGKVRNQIRKAIRSGLVAEVGGRELLTDFYSVFSQNMRDLGTPVYPRAFFENFLPSFRDGSEVIVVRLGRRPVGACIAVYFKNTIEVPWASSLREFCFLCPNNLLYWEAIRRGCERGCEEFHFGRSSRGSGSYRFKKQWGAGERNLYYSIWSADGSKLPDLDPKSLRYRPAIALWQRLPLSVANAVGPRIVRGIP